MTPTKPKLSKADKVRAKLFQHGCGFLTAKRSNLGKSWRVGKAIDAMGNDKQVLSEPTCELKWKLINKLVEEGV